MKLFKRHRDDEPSDTLPAMWRAGAARRGGMRGVWMGFPRDLGSRGDALEQVASGHGGYD
jgi:hypothetical protein